MQHFKFIFLFLLAPSFAFANFYNYDPSEHCGWWGSLEYMVVWRKARFYPPLVTFNPDPAVLPIIGTPGTEILFGGDSYRDSPQFGLRGEIGLWLTNCLGLGISGWAISEEYIDFSNAQAVDVASIGRPFIDPAGVPGVLEFSGSDSSGSIEIRAKNGVWGGDIYLRRPALRFRYFQTDFLAGGMLTSIHDDLDIESFTDVSGIIFQNQFNDYFSTCNTFYGAMLGILSQWQTCRWAFVLMAKLGVGRMIRKVEISGYSSNTTETGFTEFPTGFLALRSNIGDYCEKSIELIPQLNLQTEFKICNNFWLTAGYTWIYWPSVALAGDQIDLNLNLDQLFGGLASAPPLFEFQNTDFYIHGVTFGLRTVF